MTKPLILLLSVLTLAACDSMPNRSASDTKSVPPTSRSDATVAPTAGSIPSNNGAAAGRPSNSGDAVNGSAGTNASGTVEAIPSGMAPK